MFFPSDEAINLLANTLFALRNWYEVLQRYGIADEGMQREWEENMELGMQSDADNVFSWQRLREELIRAREAFPEQLRRICGELLRDRTAFASRTQESEKFLDHVAQLEDRLGQEGLTFDGFSIRTPNAEGLLIERIRSALQGFSESSSGPWVSQKMRERLSKAKQDLETGQSTECLTNLRLALKYQLEEAAHAVASHKKIAPTLQDEAGVRDFLLKHGFFSKEERNGYSGIYGLLSMGPHGSPDQNVVLLSFAACVLACEYCLEKLKMYSV